MTKLSRAASTTWRVHRRLGAALLEPFGLGHQTVEEPEAPAGDPDNRRGRLLVRQPVARQRQSGRRPPLLQQLARLPGRERPELMYEADAAVELGIAGEPLPQPGHAH